jgi:hypothetical protein
MDLIGWYGPKSKRPPAANLRPWRGISQKEPLRGFVRLNESKLSRAIAVEKKKGGKEKRNLFARANLEPSMQT